MTYSNLKRAAALLLTASSMSLAATDAGAPAPDLSLLAAKAKPEDSTTNRPLLIPRHKLPMKVDGRCDEYNAAAKAHLSAPENGLIYLQHDGTSLYVCVENARGEDSDGAYHLLISNGSTERDNQRAQPEQFSLWTRDGEAPAPDSLRTSSRTALKWQARAYEGVEEEGAEFQVPLNHVLIGQKTPTVSMALLHQLSGNQDDYVAWPGDAVAEDSSQFQWVTFAGVKLNKDLSRNLNATYYYDADKDGYGDPHNTYSGTTQPSGYVTNGQDCDDTNRLIYPGAQEVCNTRDDDCDNTIDEGLVYLYYYPDSDGDKYGKVGSTAKYACAAPAGYAANNTDCDDTNNTIYPGATEVCNGKDDDCDGTKDENVIPTWYEDVDKDTYGNASKYVKQCSKPSSSISYVSNNKDCNDGNANVKPGATELCNGIDDDCDKSVDETACYSGAVTVSGSAVVTDYDWPDSNDVRSCSYSYTGTLSRTTSTLMYASLICCADDEVNLVMPISVSFNASTGVATATLSPKVYESNECSTSSSELEASGTWSYSANAGASTLTNGKYIGVSDEGWANVYLTITNGAKKQ